jgi:hypothetical protein
LDGPFEDRFVEGTLADGPELRDSPEATVLKSFFGVTSFLAASFLGANFLAGAFCDFERAGNWLPDRLAGLLADLFVGFLIFGSFS